MEVSFSGGETLRRGNVKNIRSRLNLSYLLLFFLFFFDLFFFILFLEQEIRRTRSRGYIAGHTRGHGHKSHDIWKDVECSGRNNVILCVMSQVDLKAYT